METGWTIETLKEHYDAIAALNFAYEAQLRAERDRRHVELRIADQNALKIKEQGDRDALQLAREIQTYKDEKANELREQIGSERGRYATKDDLFAAIAKVEATFAPMLAYMANQQGRVTGQVSQRELIGWLIAAVSGLILLGKFVFKQ